MPSNVKKKASKTSNKKASKTATTKVNTSQALNSKQQSEQSTNSAQKAQKIVPDTSVLIDGALSRELTQSRGGVSDIIIPEAVIAELEAQANKRRETGYRGLQEINELRSLAKTQKFSLRFEGKRPDQFQIENARSGEIDNMIREVAQNEHATLFTADSVQERVAKARGVSTMFHKMKQSDKMDIEDFFDDQTMSVHIKEGTAIFAKRGRPGGWEFKTVREQIAEHHELELWSEQIITAAHLRRDAFIEIERKGSTIAQIGRYRIVITRPPFADGYEITAVRPVKRLEITEYNLSDKLKKRIDEQAEGMLIAGAPGHGKSTFAQALAEHYATLGKIIKTVEAPRDMQLSAGITQYAISHGSAEEIHDILLLSRPDYTFFDEMRNTEDFKLFADMRLSGVGMIGVMHATKTIDAIQRFLGRIELGVIPHVVDTVIFIKDGGVGAVYAITMTVKVPTGMTEADLSRPVVEVHDFESGALVFEIYTFGEQTVVIPVANQKGAAKTAVHTFAQQGLERYFERYARKPRVEVKGDKKLLVTVAEDEVARLIGKGGEHIQAIEKELGMSIDVVGSKKFSDNMDDSQNNTFQGQKKNEKKGPEVNFSVNETKSSLLIDVGRKLANVSVDIIVDGKFLMTAHASKKGLVKLNKSGKMTDMLVEALTNDAVNIYRSK